METAILWDWGGVGNGLGGSPDFGNNPEELLRCPNFPLGFWTSAADGQFVFRYVLRKILPHNFARYREPKSLLAAQRGAQREPTAG